MRHTQKALATLTIKHTDGTTEKVAKVLYREVTGRWFFTVGSAKRGCSVQYVEGNPREGFTWRKAP